MNKNDPDYEVKKAKGANFDGCSTTLLKNQEDQEGQDGDSSNQTKSAKLKQIMKNSQICKSLENFEKMKQ